MPGRRGGRVGPVAAAALVAGITVAVGAAPQAAFAATSPTLPGAVKTSFHYSKSKACVNDARTAAPTVVANGVSAAQRTLQFTRAWQFSKGQGVRVGVIDTGVNPGPAFGSRLHGLADLIVKNDPKDTEPGLDDCDGHGTLVAGIIAAAPDTTSGFSGVAPDAQIYSIRQSSSNYSYKDGQGNDQTAGAPQDLGAAIRYAVDKAKVSVINLSVAQCGAAGSVNNNDDLDAAVAYAVSKDVVIVAAAGNVDSNGPCTPQNVPGKAPVTAATPADLTGVLAVGAVDTDGSPASFSLVGGDVGVAAPGTDIISTNPTGRAGQVNTVIAESGRGSIQGTSFAAPYVTGVAALIRGAHPGWSAKDVIMAIEQTAAHPAAPGGKNQYVGYGLVDPVAAVTALRPTQSSSLVKPASNPSTLPAALVTPHSTRPEHVALYGSLVIALLIIALGIAGQTRRTRRTRRRALARSGPIGRRELSGRR